MLEKLEEIAVFAFKAGLVLAVVALVAYPLYGAVTSTGRIDYCYVSSYTYTNPTAPNVTIYNLHGHRNWRSDWLLSQNLKSVDEVKDVASKYGCELR